MARHGKPEIFKTDQGSQFTGATFTGTPADNGIAISMDGKALGATMCSSSGCGAASADGRSVSAQAYESVGQARDLIGRHSIFYNRRRLIEPLTAAPRIKLLQSLPFRAAA